MSAVPAEDPRVVHALPGRLRVHLSAWPGGSPLAIEDHLRAVQGVRRAQANPLTSNVLIEFNPAASSNAAVMDALRGLPAPATEEPVEPPTQELPPAQRDRPDRQVNVRRARIAVRGLDRDPALAREVVIRLEQHPGVRAHANPLTGRVLVEYPVDAVPLRRLQAEVADVEHPPRPGETRPRHPLDTEPLVHGVTRTGGAALGLSLLALRRMLGEAGAPVDSRIPGLIADVIGVLRGFPALRYGLRRLLGPELSDLLFSTAGIASLALSGNELGLALNHAEGVRQLTHVVPQRQAWRAHEARLGATIRTSPGATLRLETGSRTPRSAIVEDGTGYSIGPNGMPDPVGPGDTVPAGAPLYGGPFTLTLLEGKPFEVAPRPTPVVDGLLERYLRLMTPTSLGYAFATLVLTRSATRALEALILVNPRAALIGAEAADAGAFARVLRAGVTVVGTRPNRTVRLPHTVLLGGPRLLTDSFEITTVLPLVDGWGPSDILEHAAGIASAADSPWRTVLRSSHPLPFTEGETHGAQASASLQGVRYTLGSPVGHPPSAVQHIHERGEHALLVIRGDRRLGVIALRPKLDDGVRRLVEVCRKHQVELVLLCRGDAVPATAIARRAGLALVDSADALAEIRARQARGRRVAYVSDSAQAARAFAACDLAIGLLEHGDQLPARADLLAPDIGTVADIVETGARRELAARDAVILSAIGNTVGLGLGFRRQIEIGRVSNITYVSALAALAVGWQRLRGGARPGVAMSKRVVDPRPERWGQRSAAEVLAAFSSSPDGLRSEEAATRQLAAAPTMRRSQLVDALLEQARSPLVGIMAAGGVLSLFVGNVIDVLIIGATVLTNIGIGAWQERRASQASEALAQLSSPIARVLRDCAPLVIPAGEVVPGDILVLAPGERVAADARVLQADGLEVDEATLTGESLPVAKRAQGGDAASHVVLEGSDVTAGTGLALAVAVAGQTRLGSLVAALDENGVAQSPLDVRLSSMLRVAIPLAAAAGAITIVSGLLRRRPAAAQLSIGASIAIAAVPEGLPLLARMGEAAVARRLAGRNALVRRLAAIEALGRVDVACADKTGTMTDGRLALRFLANGNVATDFNGELTPALREMLLVAALASPHQEASDAGVHPTDGAVVRAAAEAGLAGDARQAERLAELGFDPIRSYHATLVAGRLCLKGAPEVLAPRCVRLKDDGGVREVDDAGRAALLARAEQLAGSGLRVLMVAEGPPDTALDEPTDLTALGFLGIADPLRPQVPAAVGRCLEAGVRVIMITGDHPATARTIAREAGLLDGQNGLLLGPELAELTDAELDVRLEHTTVIARAAPLDKVRIVESLQRKGHTVAMTGDGVNDAPALRLADVGVAMGHGTEVARQAADIVLTDDDFATLVETLVEGRSFWRNIRRATSLLLGGNLGELGLVAGPSMLGFASPLNTRQILAVNMISDVLPALSVALQGPEHRDLTGLAREGTAALERPLQRDILRRGVATALPAVGAWLAAVRFGTPVASTVGFASIVATQLAQTLDMGRTEGRLSPSVLTAVGGSTGFLVLALGLPPLRGLLLLSALPPAGWLLIAGAAVGAVALSRVLARMYLPGPALAPASA